MHGVAEDAARFDGQSAFSGRGRYRTFGHQGPLYEVLGIGASTARIRVIDTDEMLDYRLDRALADPIAD